MPNRICDVVVENYRLDPNETELRIHVEVEELTPTTEIKGRLMGPRNAYSSTVEIAYSMREVERGNRITMRVIIPEPNWWSPKSPFLYQGPLELWQDGQLCERAQVSHGIRWLQSTSKGLRLNGQPFLLHGRFIKSAFSNGEAGQLHHAGINAIVMNSDNVQIETSDLADQSGFLVLVDWIDHLSTLLGQQKWLNKHPSTFGWITHKSDWVDPTILKITQPMFAGIHRSAGVFPAGISFEVCDASELASFDGIDLPKIVLTKRRVEPLPTRPDVIGWIETI